MSVDIVSHDDKVKIKADVIEKRNGCQLLKLQATHAVFDRDNVTWWFNNGRSARKYYNSIKNAEVV